MQSSADRQRLMRMYRDDLTAPTWSLVGRCGTGLAIVALIAVFGRSAKDTELATSHIASMKASRGGVAQGSTKTLGEWRQRSESDPDPLVAVDMEASQPDATQPTVLVGGP